MKVFCIIPAWNESERIRQVLTDVQGQVDEIIVVDDCSTDQTSDLAVAGGVIVLSHLVNRGQGASLRTGTNYVLQTADNHDIIVHFDADGQMRAEDIAKVIAPLQHNQAEMVLGSRFLDKSTKMPWLKKQIIMPLARLVNMIFFKVRLTDPQSGFRAFTVETGKKLNWSQDGMSHCSEILALAQKKKLKIIEVPVTIIYHNFGQKLSGGFKIIKDLLIAKLIN